MNGEELELLPGRLAICRLDPEKSADLSLADFAGGFVSLTRSEAELSLVCGEESTPAGVPCQFGWRALRVCGPLDFSLVGVLASLLDPLTEAGVSVFVLSTYDTDYILIREDDLEPARRALIGAGHHLSTDPPTAQ